LIFPSGTYLITGSNNNMTDGLNISISGVSIIGNGNVVIKQDSSSFYALSINNNNGGTTSISDNTKDINIDNIQFQATVSVDGFSEFRHLLNINAATNVLINNCKFVGFRGDGVYIGSSNTTGVERHNKNIRILNCRFDGVNNQNRNGVSVIDVDGLIMEKCDFKNSTKSNMTAAIDNEQDAQTFHITKNILINKNLFKNISWQLGSGYIFGKICNDKKAS